MYVKTLLQALELDITTCSKLKRVDSNPQSHLTLIGIPVQCKPKGYRQVFPFSLWYPTANYRKKLNFKYKFKG